MDNMQLYDGLLIFVIYFSKLSTTYLSSDPNPALLSAPKTSLISP